MLYRLRRKLMVLVAKLLLRLIPNVAEEERDLKRSVRFYLIKTKSISLISYNLINFREKEKK